MSDDLERVALRRTGAGGEPLQVTVESSFFSEEECVVLGDLRVRAAGEVSPDGHQYELMLSMRDGEHRVVLGEDDLDEQLRPLVERLEQEARPPEA